MPCNCLQTTVHAEVIDADQRDLAVGKAAQQQIAVRFVRHVKNGGHTVQLHGLPDATVLEQPQDATAAREHGDQAIGLGGGANVNTGVVVP